jgi:phage terminase small subunit
MGSRVLTEQQRKFAERVAVHGNHTRAAEEAGYRHPNVISVRLVKLPGVADEIARVRGIIAKKADRKTVADANEIQVFLTKVMRGQIKDYDLTLSGDVEELPPKLAERRKASMDLAKVQGLLKERVEHTGAGGGPIELAGVPFRELLELARTGGGDD